MIPTPCKSLLVLGLLAASLLSVVAAEPTADQILRRMSATLAAAQTFRFVAVRDMDVALLPGIEVAGKVRIAALVQRPDKFAARAVSQAGERQFIADGRTLTLFESRKNFYAIVPMSRTIDGLVAELDANYGFTPPLAEFAVSNPYQEFRRQAHTIALLGRGKIGGGFLGLGAIECYHLLLKGPVADAELWVGVSDHLPRKLVATFHGDGQPQVRIAFLKWNLAAQATPADFTFTPPKGAQKIEMWTTAKMKAARKP